jgi:hypothetical protein
MCPRYIQDVLCGISRMTNSHPGNHWFRTLIGSNYSLYQNSQKHVKLLVAKHVVLAGIHQQSPPGRFIESITTGYDGAIVGWTQMTFDQALSKTSQALREKGPLHPLTPPVIIMDENLDKNMENTTAVETTSRDNTNMNNNKQTTETFARIKETGTQLSMELEHRKKQRKQQAIRDLKRRKTDFGDNADGRSHLNAILINSDDDNSDDDNSDDDGSDAIASASASASAFLSEQTKHTTLVSTEETIDKTVHALHYPNQHQKVLPTRLAAAVFVESPWNNKNGNGTATATAAAAATNNTSNSNASSGRKSTSQPRPVLNVLPRGYIGPIADPNENDILCGSGSRIKETFARWEKAVTQSSISRRELMQQQLDDNTFYRPAEDGGHLDDDADADADADADSVHVDDSGGWRDLGEEYYGSSDDDCLVF